MFEDKKANKLITKNVLKYKNYEVCDNWTIFQGILFCLPLNGITAFVCLRTGVFQLFIVCGIANMNNRNHDREYE